MAVPGFYNQADQALYDQGNYFLPQEKYRVDLGTSTGVPNKVEFNPSQEGIASLQQPYPYYGDNQGDQDDENNIPTGPTGTTQEGFTGYDTLGNPINNNMSPWGVAKNVFGFMTNPIGYLGYKAYGAYKNNQAIKAQDKFYADKEANQNFQDMVDSNRSSNTGGYQAGWGSDFMGDDNGGSTSSGGNSPGDPGGSDSMGSHANGGRVGLNYGGLVSLF